MDTLKEHHPVTIAVSGIIGAGKSTLSNELGKLLQVDVYDEPVKTNPYLDLFYEDMKTHAFAMQVFFLTQRYKQQQQITWSGKDAVLDRCIFEDTIFAALLHKQELLSDLNFKTYLELFETFQHSIKLPDVVVYLRVDPKIAMERVKKRARACESGLTMEYLTELSEAYDEWAKEMEQYTKVLYLDWNTFQDPRMIALAVRKLLAGDHD